jgi:hypothetical protein
MEIIKELHGSPSSITLQFTLHRSNEGKIQEVFSKSREHSFCFLFPVYALSQKIYKSPYI